MKRRTGTPAAAWFYGQSFNARREYKQCRRPGCLVTICGDDDGLCVACRLIEAVKS